MTNINAMAKQKIIIASLIKFSRYLVVAAIFFALLVLCHFYFAFIGSAPAVAVDDSLANVSVILAKQGHLGSYASPIQSFSYDLRLDHFYNYGPITFVIGALLDWLFGTSYTILRSIYLVGLLLISFAGFFCFRRISLAASGLFVGLFISLFWFAQWPMFRPDIITSTLIAFTLLAQTWALTSDKKNAWVLTGFFGASAAGNHQIATSMIPIVGLIWILASVIYWYAEKPEKTAFIQKIRDNFSAVLLGFILAGLVFLVGVHFEVIKLWHLWHAYAYYASHGDGTGFKAATLLVHWQVATTNVPSLLIYVLLIISSLGGVLLLYAQFLSTGVRSLISGYLLPPTVAGVCYFLSLGFYHNFHDGYAIPIHIFLAWQTAATGACLLFFIKYYRKNIGELLEWIAQGIIIVYLIFSSCKQFTSEPYWVTLAHKSVNFTEYSNRILEALPNQSSIWGDMIFGLDSGDRVNLIQVTDGAAFLNKFKDAYKKQMAPDFLMLNGLLATSAFQFVDNEARNNIIAILQDLTHFNYHQVSIVDAEPYGPTIVYQVSPTFSTEKDSVPSIAVYAPATLQWTTKLGTAFLPHFVNTTPVHFVLSYGARTATSFAHQSIQADVAGGIYLAKIKLKHDNNAVGTIFATDTKNFSGSGGDLDFDIGQAPYFAQAENVYLIVHHNTDGPLYFSQYDTDRHADFTIEALYPLQPIQFKPNSSYSLPNVSIWQPVGSNVSKQINSNTVLVTGDNSISGYQIKSSQIHVQPHTIVNIMLNLRSFEGHQAMGILDEAGQWLVSPADFKQSSSFNTRRNRFVYIVIVNNNENQAQPLPRSVFQLTAGSITLTPEKQNYIHELAVCYLYNNEHRKVKPAFCK